MIYCFKCPACNEHEDVSRSMQDSGLPEICACGETMVRDFQREHSAIRGDYNDPIVSDSMAFNTQDLAEHRKRFPDVDLKVDMAGRTASPILRSLSQKRAYLKARGWKDANSYV